LLYNADNFRQNRKKRFAGHSVAGYACQIGFSPDGKWISSGDAEGNMVFWDWKTCRIKSKLKCHDKVVITHEWLQHETSKVVTGSWDGLIKLWVSCLIVCIMLSLIIVNRIRHHRCLFCITLLCNYCFEKWNDSNEIYVTMKAIVSQQYYFPFVMKLANVTHRDLCFPCDALALRLAAMISTFNETAVKVLLNVFNTGQS
jgi:hypothetical protein